MLPRCLSLRVISQRSKEERTQKEHQRSYIRLLFLDPLDDTPFIFAFVLFLFLSGLVALSLICFSV